MTVAFMHHPRRASATLLSHGRDPGPSNDLISIFYK